MLQSMTGYGSALVESEMLMVKAEIKSINSKILDQKIKLPYRYQEKEIELQNIIESRLGRGKIDLSITVRQINVESVKRSVNKELVKEYYKDLDSICKDLKISNDNVLQVLMELPDTLSPNIAEENIKDEEWSPIKEAVEKAIVKLVDFRKSEGEKLEKEIDIYLSSILELQEFVKGMLENRMNKKEDKIKAKIAELKLEMDQNRFEQEMIYFLEKLDISEEVDRLETHVNYFRKTMQQEEFSGKKLSFICQEIGREINTMGAKANDADIQKNVVQMKNELEKIKQQLANIL
jgi:uncharacterized protein (TIGR00255 family)